MKCNFWFYSSKICAQKYQRQSECRGHWGHSWFHPPRCLQWASNCRIWNWFRSSLSISDSRLDIGHRDHSKLNWWRRSEYIALRSMWNMNIHPDCYSLLSSMTFRHHLWLQQRLYSIFNIRSCIQLKEQHTTSHHNGSLFCSYRNCNILKTHRT